MRNILIAIILFFTFTICLADEIEFDPSRGLVEVEVLIDGRVKGTFGIDTGADRLYVDKQFAEKNNLRIFQGSPQRAVTGVNGSSEAGRLKIRSLMFGDHKLYNLKATTIDIGKLATSSNTDYPDGLIGHEILKNFYVTVDFPRRKMLLRTGEPDEILESLSDGIPFKMVRHLIVIDVDFGDGIEVPMAIDYCAGMTTISPNLAEQLDLSSDPEKRQWLSSVTIGDDITATNVVCSVADLSNIFNSRHTEKLQGLIGGSFLAHFRMTVDYKRKKLYLHR